MVLAQYYNRIVFLFKDNGFEILNFAGTILDLVAGHGFESCINTIMNKKYLSPLVSCIHCRVEKSAKGIFSHYFSKHDLIGSEKMKNIRQMGTDSSFRNPEFQEKFNLSKISGKIAKSGNCKECDSEISTASKRKFCSHSCAAKFNNRIRCKNSHQETTKKSKRIVSGKYCKVSWCKVCGKLIPNSHNKSCSLECKTVLTTVGSHKGGKASASKIVKRSKDEISLYNLCKEQFQSVRHNEVLIDGWDADIIIDEYKIAILWNGPWHYHQMPHKNHSLSQVQNRDKIKMKLFSEAGWNVLIYQDNHYTPSSAFQDILLRTLDSN